MTTQDCCYSFLYLSTPQPFHHTCFCWYVQQTCFYWLASFLFPVVFHSCAILSPLFICLSCLLNNFNIYVVLMLYILHLLDNLLQLWSLLSCWFISTWFYFDRFKNTGASYHSRIFDWRSSWYRSATLCWVFRPFQRLYIHYRDQSTCLKIHKMNNNACVILSIIV